MKISSDSWLIRYLYWGPFGDFGPPQHTTLCRMFWRFVFVTIASIVIIALPTAFVVALGLNIYQSPKEVATVFGVLVGLLLAYLTIRRSHEYYVDNVVDSVVGEAIYAVKNRVCPIIHITHEE